MKNSRNDRSTPLLLGLRGAITWTLVSTGSYLHAADPAWWRQSEFPAIDASLPSEPKGVANIGQAKWMASQALAEVRAVAPALATAIETNLIGPGKPIPTWDAPTTAGEKEKQKAPLLVGQLKAIAAPFYTQLNTSAAAWLQSEMQFYQTRVSGTYFPWTANDPSDDSNLSIATLNQVKALFSFRFTESLDGDDTPDFIEMLYTGTTSNTLPPAMDADGDGLPDAWENQWFGSLNNPAGGAAMDPDGDGLSNLEEYKLGQNPTSSVMPSGPGLERFTYDDNGRLKKVAGPVSRSYSVDAAGNVESQN